MKTRLFSVFLLIIICQECFSQVDLLSLVDSVQKPQTREKIYATFKTTKIINAQSVETVKKRSLDFRITHRFGNIGGASNGGFHTWYGWDAISDIRMAFDYGITDKITLGLARSKYNELIDGTFKCRLLEQTVDNKIPVSLTLYENMGVSPQRSAQFYTGTINVKEKFAHRISYVNQLIIARKFNSRFSFELLPTYTHLNYVRADINPENNAVAENDLISVGVGGRIRLTKRFSILADYFYTFSEFRKNNPVLPYYNPLAIGVEIETGGHVFHLNFTNAVGINENVFITNSPDSWMDGGYKFGFNISRVF
jgi:hypothetical protein